MTLGQILVYLPTLYKVYGPKIAEGTDENEKFEKAATWLKEVAGVPEPSLDHILKVAERM